DARQVAEEFNQTAKLSRVSVFVMMGRVAPDDVEAVRAINKEVRDLLEEMKVGVSNLNAEAIREAANKARGLGSMLTPDAAARIQLASESARKAGRAIVKAGNAAAVEIDRRAIRAITEARTAFLDLDENGEEVQAPKLAARTIDLSGGNDEVSAPKV